MFRDILRCLAAFMAILLFARAVHSAPADDVIRSEALKDMRKYMNESADPCVDFYEFTCGNWGKYYPSSEYVAQTTFLEVVGAMLNEDLKNIMKTNDPADKESDQKLKILYKSCTDLPSHKDTYLNGIKNLLEEFGKMPAMAGDEWQEESFDWQQTVADIMSKYGDSTIFVTEHSSDVLGIGADVILLEPAFVPHESKSFYPTGELTDVQKTYAVNNFMSPMVNFLNIPKDVAFKTGMELLEFETALVQGFLDNEKSAQLHEIYRPTTVEKLQSKYSPVLNFTQYFLTVFGTIPPYTIYVHDKFFENLVAVIPKTPKKTVANYIFFQLFKNFYFPPVPRQDDYCISEVKKAFPSHFENMMYRRYTNKRTLTNLDVMWKSLKDTYANNLQSARDDWINPEVRNYALDKLNAMQLEIPSSIVSKGEVRRLELSAFKSEDFLGNMKSIRSVTAEETKKNILKPAEDALKQNSKAVFSPAHILSANIAIIPIGVLQSHYLLSASLPNAYNFGRLGTILGHEITHGFDGKGRYYDKNGKAKDWWNADFVKEFNKRAECFADQFSQYEYGGVKLPRTLHQDENIADAGGMYVSYMGYLKWCEENAIADKDQEYETFQGFPYNNKQLFFISFGQEWCADTQDKVKSKLVALDAHSPSEVRVNAEVSNMNAFSEVFSCPVGSPMNPVKKCQMY